MTPPGAGDESDGALSLWTASINFRLRGRPYARSPARAGTKSPRASAHKGGEGAHGEAVGGKARQSPQAGAGPGGPRRAGDLFVWLQQDDHAARRPYGRERQHDPHQGSRRKRAAYGRAANDLIRGG